MLCMVPTLGLRVLPGDAPIGDGVIGIGMALAPVLGAPMLNPPIHTHGDMFFPMC